MNRFPLLLLVVGMLAAPCFAQASLEDRVKALEAENRQLREDLQAARQRLQALESGGTAAATAAPKTTDDPGPDNYGNPLAVRRTLGQMLREHLAARNIAVPDGSSDARAVAAYRAEVERWLRDPNRQRRLRQPIAWTVEVLEARVVSDSSSTEYALEVHSLNADGARVGPWYTIRCRKSDVPQLNPLDARGTWLLRGEVIAELSLAPAESSKTPNSFRPRDTIAPDVECSLRFVVSSLQRPSQAAAPTR